MEAIVANKPINRAGGQFKIDQNVANNRVLLGANKRTTVREKTSRKKKEQKKKDTKESAEVKAIIIYDQWVKDGKKLGSNGYPKLCKVTSIAVVKVLLPRIEIEPV